MKIKTMSVDSLVMDPNNARMHPDRNLEAIKGSLLKFGQQKPIVIDPKGIVIAGNGTLEAARQLGWKKIDVVESTLTGFDATAYALADNRSSELAIWDENVLAMQLHALQEIDFNIAEIGFDIPPAESPDDDFDSNKEDDVPESAPSRVKYGEVWKLGNHRLMCGDSTSAKDFTNLMGDSRAVICFTSPPYNAGKFDVHVPNVNQPSRTEKYLTVKDDMTPDQYLNFLQDVLNLTIEYCDTVMLNIGMIEGNKREVIRLLANNVNIYKESIYWRKSTSTPHIQPGILTMVVEPIFCFGKHNSRQFKSGNFKGNLGNVIEGSNASGNEFAKKHAATFPVYLPEWAITNFTVEGDIVLEPFCGTGTTIIAAEKTKRRCFAMEIDPEYCDIAISRWEDITGKKAELVDGK